MQTYIQPSWCHCHSLSLASVKSRLILPFRYRLTRVVPDKGPLNVCVCVCVNGCVCIICGCGCDQRVKTSSSVTVLWCVLLTRGSVMVKLTAKMAPTNSTAVSDCLVLFARPGGRNVRRILVRGVSAWGEENFKNLTTKWCILEYIWINMWSA